MNPYSGQLQEHRKALNDALATGAEFIRSHWTTVEVLMNNWWTTYKSWESKDTFNEAFTQKRMTIRSFDKGFDKQVSKNFAKGTLRVVSQVKNSEGTLVEETRVFKDNKNTPFTDEEMKTHNRNFEGPVESQKYHAQRGIDSSKFANPDNFLNRETKYNEGLHDLSASLLNPNISIFEQVHNHDQGAHYSFIPLSEEEDQETLYTLTKLSKQLVDMAGFAQKVRRYRAEMTRLKLAAEVDMAIGYTITPHKDWATRTGKPAPKGRGFGPNYKPAAPIPAYKLKYSLGMLTTVWEDGQQKAAKVTPELLEKRQENARHFKRILGIYQGKNEIVIAIRKHDGPFPVYGVRAGDVIKVYRIGTSTLDANKKTMVYTKQTISSSGVLT